MTSHTSSPRLAAIDQFRGFAILLMVLANYLAGVKFIPAWLKHAPDIGLTVIDLVAPFFIFAIGLTYGPSWARRSAREGTGKTIQHFVTRFLAIAGLGLILSAGEIWLEIDGTTVNWGVLQAIGVAGLITLFVIQLPTSWRLGIGLAILAVYQYVLDHFWLASVLGSPHGGLPGSISWAGMLILATVLADIYHDPARRRYFLAAALLGLAIGLLAATQFPVSKNRVSASYDLISLGISSSVFFLFDRLKICLVVLAAWGKNPLVLYILHLLLLGLMVLPNIPAWYAEAPPWLVFFQAAGLLGLLSGIGLVLESKSAMIVL